MSAAPANPQYPVDSYAEARRAAFNWRGECIGYFTTVEQRVSALLVRAQDVSPYAEVKPPFPHLVGQRFERLRKLLELDGPMRSHAEQAVRALDEFAMHDELRTFLCHGELEVAITKDETVVFLFRVLNFRKQSAVETKMWANQSDVNKQRRKLSAATEALVDTLASLEKCFLNIATVSRAK